MDPIGNLLTTLRNAEMAGHSSTKVRDSKLNQAILKIMQAEGYVGTFAPVGETHPYHLLVNLKKLEKGRLHHFKRLSKPGRRVYTDVKAIPLVLRGAGLVILSTSRGVLSGKTAHKEKVGGELLCELY